MQQIIFCFKKYYITNIYIQKSSEDKHSHCVVIKASLFHKAFLLLTQSSITEYWKTYKQYNAGLKYTVHHEQNFTNTDKI